MPLPAGTKVGPYEILSALGAGGMGEVYRARDAKLGRDVALKTLSASFTHDPQRLARFRREAQVLAALNHPHVGAIYGLDEAEGQQFLVLELVEGESFDRRIARGPIPIDEALSIAREIAEALEAAHDRAIIHRDLKPGNIALTTDGHVKVLDFGLAKVTEVAGAASVGVENAPTVTTADLMTDVGAILGTAAYMSPEQARGRVVDKRCDIWAFGCVLYEMLTGRRAFPGQTTSDTIAAVLEREPAWDRLPDATPSGIRRLIRRCLEKTLKRRLRDIGDARIELEDALAGASDTTVAGRPIAPRRDVQFQRLTDFVGTKESPAISPDGKMVVFAAPVNGRRQIWIRLLTGGVSIQVTRDDGEHEHPRWAPDSSTIIYYKRPATPGEEGVLWEIAALGGPPRRLASAIGGGDISHDGRRIAIFRSAGEKVELVMLARGGSHAERVTLLPADRPYSLPRWSPDDRWIGFLSASSAAFDNALEIVSAADGERRAVAHSPWLRGFSWLPDGSGLVFSSSAGSTLLYPPIFNLRTIGRDGAGDRQLTFGDVSYVDPDVHQTHKLVACKVRSQSDIWRFPVSGPAAENTNAAIRITRQTGLAQTPSASPDGTEVVYLSDNGGHGNLWVATTSGSDVRQITFERDPAVAIGVPMWSPAGDRIAFLVTRSAQTGLSVIHPDGSGLREMARGWSACWSRDGRWLYYTPTREGARGLEKVSADGGPPIVVREESCFGLAMAADGVTLYDVHWPRNDIFGRWGDAEIRCLRLDNGPPRVLTHIAGLRVPLAPLILQPFLSPDGRSLALQLMDGATTNLWALPTDGGPLRQLTDFGDRAIMIVRSISWSADSQHLYAAVAESETDVVLFDGLTG
jgi:serine/threonine protein kinase